MNKEKIKTDFRELRLLIVEDGEDILNIMDSTFKMLVKDIYLANNGDEAYKLFVEKKPDLVITDIRMPVLNGSELIKKIRQIDKDIPIFVVSAYVYDLENSQKELVNAVFEKPIDFIEVVNEIDKCNIKPRNESN